MSYATDKIRNIALLGHGSNGKTSLAESILYITGAVDRLGKVNDGNSTGDYDSEETKRKISIYTASMFTEYKNHKINILDTPGYFDFAGEVVEALRVADAGIIVCGAKDGLTVGAEKSWKYLSERNLPRLSTSPRSTRRTAALRTRTTQSVKSSAPPSARLVPIKNGAKLRALST
jgi:elongation factor G